MGEEDVDVDGDVDGDGDGQILREIRISERAACNRFFILLFICVSSNKSV